MRFCYCCGSTRTYVAKNGTNNWYLNQDLDNNVLCANCMSRLYPSKPSLKGGFGPGTKEWREYRRKQTEKTICFKGKYIILPFKIPRKLKCEMCGKRGKTHIHHTKYDGDNPLEYTIQICPSCHAKEGFRLGQLTGTRDPKCRFRG